MRFAGIGLYRYRLDGTIVFIDEGSVRILDLQDEYPDSRVLRGRQIGDLLHYSLPKGYLRRLVLEKGRAHNLRYPFETLSGKKRWALHDSYLVTDEESKEQFIQVIIRDITALKEAEAERDQEHERLLVTLRSIGDGVIATDAEGKITLLNREAEALTGWKEEDARGRKLADVFKIINEFSRKPAVNPVEQVLASGMVVGLANHTVLVSRDGTERSIADSGAPIFNSEGEIVGVVLVFRDVTDELRTQEERERREKLESLGLLAGGIAHDFNNILTSVVGNISLARLCLESGDSDELTECLKQAEAAALQTRALTNQLLTFSKGGAPVRRRVFIGDFLRDSVTFALHGSPVESRFSIEEELWPVEADLDQLTQVVNNLVINAKQAMANGGVISVCAQNVVADGSQSAPVKQGEYVVLKFEDSGVGIPSDKLAKIFDPYYTTKQDGTGLGLATVYSIVKRHEGNVTVESSPGRGARFLVYLPASPDKSRDSQAFHERAADGGGRRILLMDDEDAVRATCASMLRRLKYEPVTVSCGEEAIASFRRAMEEDRPFAAVILDLTIKAGTGGADTIRSLRELDPDVKAIVASGYSTDPVMSEYGFYGFDNVIHKPYNVIDLAKALADILA